VCLLVVGAAPAPVGVKLAEGFGAIVIGSAVGSVSKCALVRAVKSRFPTRNSWLNP